jgi:hypothetical protein
VAIAAPTERSEARLVGGRRGGGRHGPRVYRYYPSKTALLDEAVASGLRRLEARLREAADGAAIRLTIGSNAC